MMFLSRLKNLLASLLPYTLMGVSFFMPISYRLTTYFLVLTVVFWLFSMGKNDFKRVFRNSRIALILSLLWFLYVASLLYSTDVSRGLTNLSHSISLLLFPLIITTRWNLIFSQFKNILKVFCLGLIILGVYFISNALAKSVIFPETGLLFQPRPTDAPWENYFFYDLFTRPKHPTYISMYYAFGLAIIGYLVYPIKFVRQRLKYYIFACFYCLIIYLASSKAGLVVGGFVLIFFLLWAVKSNNQKYYGIGIGMLIILFSIVLAKNERVNFFWKQLTSETAVEGLTSEQIDFENKLKDEVIIRLQIWKAVPKIVGDSWMFGVGIGDAKDELVKYYHENNIMYADQMRLNAHNQYLETYLALGIVGLLVLLSVVFYSGFLALRRGNVLLFLFTLIIGINLIFESMLERFPGVVFVSFFLVLLSQKTESDLQ